MKKFLTVLLALSVVFTYTFGTAFAAAADPSDPEQRSLEQVKAEIAENAKALQGANVTAAATALDTLFPGTATELTVKADSDSKSTTDEVSTVVLSKSVVMAYFTNMVKEANDKIDIAKNTAIQDAVNKSNVVGFISFNSNTEVATDVTKYPQYNKDFSANTLKTLVATKHEASNVSDKAGAYLATITTTFTKITIGSGITLPSGIVSNDYVLANADAKDLVAAQYAKVKADQIEAIQKIDTTVYSTTVSKGETLSNNQKAIAAKNDALNAIGKMAVTSATTVGIIGNYITSVNALYSAPVGLSVATGSLYNTDGKLLYGLTYSLAADTGILTVSGAGTALNVTGTDAVTAKKLAYGKDKVLAELTKSINTAQQKFIEEQQKTIFAQQLLTRPNATTIKTCEDAIATAKADFPKVIEVVTYLVNQVEDPANLIDLTSLAVKTGNWAYANNSTDAVYSDDTLTLGVSGTTDSVARLVAKADRVAELKKDAELYKQAILIDGSMLYDIDADLKDKIDKVYTADTTKVLADITLSKINLADALDAYKTTLVGTDLKKVTIKTVEYPKVGAWFAAAFTGYDKAKYDELRAVKTLAEDSIDAAKTFDEADAAFLAAYAKFKAIPTTSEHEALFNMLGSLNTKYTKYALDFNAYVDGKAAALVTLGTNGDYYTGWVTGVKAYYSAATTGSFQVGVYTEADLDKAYADAKAFVDTLKTTKQLADQKKAIMAKMAAVPATVTLADKATVTAIAAEITAFNDYCDVIGNAGDKIATFGQEASIQKLDADKIVVAYNAINKDGKATLDEKAAVLELKKAFDAYVKEYQGTNAATDLTNAVGTTATVTKAEITTFVGQIDALEAKDVEILIAKLPMYVTSADVKAIQAAKTAYDALTANGRSLVNTDMKTKLTAALKVLEQYEVAAVTGLKITASSVAKKGKITVKWRVQPKNVKVDGYQVYKSTKKFSAYKKAFTTTKLTYKNTKQLKKGTTYYYKVRAYKVLDGKKVYSDWSNKAVRVAK